MYHINLSDDAITSRPRRCRRPHRGSARRDSLRVLEQRLGLRAARRRPPPSPAPRRALRSATPPRRRRGPCPPARRSADRSGGAPRRPPHRQRRSAVVLITSPPLSSECVAMRLPSTGCTSGTGHPPSGGSPVAWMSPPRHTYTPRAPLATSSAARRSAARPLPMPPRSMRTPGSSSTRLRSSSSVNPGAATGVDHPGLGASRRAASMSRKRPVVAPTLERLPHAHVEHPVGLLVEARGPPQREPQIGARRDPPTGTAMELLQLARRIEPRPRALEHARDDRWRGGSRSRAHRPRARRSTPSR